MTKADPGRAKSLEIEFIVRTKQVFGTRIHPGGKAEETHDGTAWESLAELAPDAMAELQEVVASAGFFDLPDRIEPKPPVRDGTSVTWRISLDGRTHRVVERRGTGATNAALAEIEQAIERLIGEELNRKADSSS